MGEAEGQRKREKEKGRAREREREGERERERERKRERQADRASQPASNRIIYSTGPCKMPPLMYFTSREREK